MKRFLKLAFFGLPAAAVHLGEVVLFNGKSSGFPDWVADRKTGDPQGRPLQSRKEALEEQRVHSLRSLTVMLLLMGVMATMSSCVQFKRGDVSFTAAGMDATRIEIPGLLVMDGVNMSNGLKSVTTMVSKMWSNYLMAEGLKFVADKYYTLEGAKVSATSAENLEALRNAKSAADAQHALDVLKATPIETVPITTTVVP